MLEESKENSSQKRKGKCPNCKTEATIEGPDFLVRCPNCSEIFVFLCHVLSPNKDD